MEEVVDGRAAEKSLEGLKDKVKGKTCAHI